MSSEKKLIVTADDFGLTEGINKGIIHAYQEGIVTRTSIMANGRAFEHAVSLAGQNKDLKIGIHLTLVEEKPLNRWENIKSILTSDATLLKHSKWFLLRYITHRINFSEVDTEFQSQIEKVLSSGININHIDSHQHLHMLPGIFELTLRIARKYQIKKIRTYQCNIAYVQGLKELTLAVLTKLYKRQILRSDIELYDNLFGLGESGNINETDLLGFLDKMKSGSTEIICHPGYSDEEYLNIYNHWHYTPEVELKALMSNKVIEKLKRMKILLDA